MSTVTYNEFLCYWLHYQSWPRCHLHHLTVPAVPLPRLPSSEDAGEFTTLLLVADPQVLCLSTLLYPPL